jgi:hypothetical protein
MLGAVNNLFPMGRRRRRVSLQLDDDILAELSDCATKGTREYSEKTQKFLVELDSATNKSIADMYHRFIEKSINILNVSLATVGEDSISTERVVVMLEFSYERPKDGRIIWPKICISGETALGAISRAERVIDDIRSR